MDHHSDPICFIIPPHMLEQIAQNGTEAQQAKATATIQSAMAFRQGRLAGPKIAAAATPTAAVKKRSVYNCNHSTNLPGTLVRGEGAPATGDARCGRGLRRRRRDLRPVLGCLPAQLDRWRRPGAGFLACTTRRATTTPSGTARRWSTATATKTCRLPSASSTASPSPSM